MQFFLKNVALFSLFAIMVSATSKFANTCREIQSYGSELRAECQEFENGQLRPTSIDLNRCLKNNKGSLKVNFSIGSKISDNLINTDFM